MVLFGLYFCKFRVVVYLVWYKGVGGFNFIVYFFSKVYGFYCYFFIDVYVVEYFGYIGFFDF